MHARTLCIDTLQSEFNAVHFLTQAIEVENRSGCYSWDLRLAFVSLNAVIFTRKDTVSRVLLL